MRVTLIGYRGTGKSSVAAQLANRLNCQFFDADVEIERRAGMTIREIFSASGEPEFRRIEREVMTDLLQRKDLIIAAGGGAVVNEHTRAELIEQSKLNPVVWLRAGLETIVDRISADTTTAERRPNLTAQGGREEVASLLAEREPIYREASTHIIETDGLSVPEVVETILSDVIGSRGDGR